MAIPVENFIGKPQQFEGLYQAANQLERNKVREDDARQRQDIRKNATSTFLKDYLDPKDHLTGTNYDPQIVGQLQEAMSEGAALAAKGADTATIMMALGPKVNKISQYSTKAKLINQQIKDSLGRLKGYKGYNTDALEMEAKKMAFTDDKGQLKDINTIDPNTDWITETVKMRPELTTTGAGLDDFVTKTPMADYSRTVETANKGVKRNVEYEAKHPFWMDLQRDEKGEIALDPAGNPMGLDVVGSDLIGDDNKPMINPETNKPYRVMDKNHFNAIMQHNPDIADYIRGQVNIHFKEAGAKEIPQEGTPQWEMMARGVLHDELKTRDKSFFKTKDQQKQTGIVDKIQLMQDPTTAAVMKRLANLDDNSDPNKPPKVNTVQALGRAFNNDPDYISGDKVTVNGKEVIDITSRLPGGGLKHGRGEDEKYKSVYLDPKSKSLIVETEESTPYGLKKSAKKEIPQAEVGRFITKIATANGVPVADVRKYLDEMGYSGGKFKQSTTEEKPAEKKTGVGIVDRVKGFFGYGNKEVKKAPATKKNPEDLRKKYNY